MQSEAHLRGIQACGDDDPTTNLAESCHQNRIHEGYARSAHFFLPNEPKKPHWRYQKRGPGQKTNPNEPTASSFQPTARPFKRAPPTNEPKTNPLSPSVACPRPPKAVCHAQAKRGHVQFSITLRSASQVLHPPSSHQQGIPRGSGGVVGLDRLAGSRETAWFRGSQGRGDRQGCAILRVAKGRLIRLIRGGRRTMLVD